MSSRVTSCLVPWLLFFLVGCAQGQTGGEIGATTSNTDGEGAWGRCEEGESAPVEPDQALDGLDFRLEDLIGLVEGEHETSMAWNSSGPIFSGKVVVTPAAELTDLEITVTPRAETGRVQDFEQADSDGSEGPAVDIEEPACSDRLSLEADVIIRSSNGALDEQFVATFWTTDGIVAHADVPIDASAVRGSFAVDVSGMGDKAELRQTDLRLGLAFGSMNGTLSGMVVTNDGEAAVAGGFEFAKFPAENPCESGFALQQDAPVRAEIEELLSQYESYDFTWTGRPPSQELSIETTLGAVCYMAQQYYPGEPQLQAKVESRVKLEDGSIDGTWALDAFVTYESDGEVAQVQVVRNNYLAETFAPGAFAEEAGISGISSDADGLTFSFGFVLDAAGTANGELTVMELTVPDCVTSGAAGDNEEIEGESGSEVDGSGSPGCQGTEATEIENATFVGRAR